MRNTTLTIIGVSLLTVITEAQEISWPQWRGPLSNGVATEGNPALEWSEEKNIKWKVETTGSGTSTPIIVGDRIFLLTAAGTGKKVEVKEPTAGADAEVPPSERRSPRPEGRAEIRPARGDGAAQGDRARRGGRGEGRRRGGFGRGQKPDEVHQFSVVCLDRRTGNSLWSKVVKEVLPHEGHHRDHGYASASPVTDGEHIYAYFGSRGLYCLDLEGNLKWEKEFGQMRISNGFGEGSSPALHGDTLVVIWDHEGDSFIAALDKKTGSERWRKTRDERTSWATPFIVEHAGSTQVIANATGKIASYDLKTGDIIWESEGMTRNVIPTPVAGDGILYAMSGFRGSALQAIKLDGKGNLKGTDAILWSHDEGTPYVPSPLLYENRLFFFQGNDARLSCLDANTGKVHYSRETVDGLRGVYASPIGARGHIYLVGRKGTVAVIQSSADLKVVATNKLDDEFDASPAVVGDELFLRGKKYLYCITEAK